MLREGSNELSLTAGLYVVLAPNVMKNSEIKRASVTEQAAFEMDILYLKIALIITIIEKIY